MMAHEGRVRVQTTRRLAANHLFKATIQQSYCNRSSRVHTGSSTEKTKRFSRNRSVVPGERVEDDDGHAAVIPAGGLGLVVALHGYVVVEGARRQPHQPATKRARSRGGQVRLRLGLRERSRVGAHRLKGSMEAMVAMAKPARQASDCAFRAWGAGRVPDRAGRRPPPEPPPVGSKRRMGEQWNERKGVFIDLGSDLGISRGVRRLGLGGL